MFIDFGKLPNNTIKNVSFTLPSGVTNFWIDSAWATSAANTIRYPIPYVDAGAWNNAIGITLTATRQVQIKTTTDWSTYPAYVVIAYKL